MATLASAPALEVVSMAGKPIKVDLEGVGTVAELRGRVASALGASSGSVKLLSGQSLLEDAASPSGLITALVSSPGPSWYPASKYLHEGKEVLKVKWGIDHNRGHEEHNHEVVYTDGTRLEQRDAGRVQRNGEEDWEVAGRVEKITGFAKKLVKDLGFVTHKLEEYSDQPCFTEEYEAVPPEDPDEWEPWTDGFCARGERRKQASCSAAPASADVQQAPAPAPALDVQGSAQQADGMPGIAFRLGCRHDEPLLDIPNGTRIQCLAGDGEWLIVAFQGKVGFVKERNVAAMAGECTPLALLEKVVARQADGHSTVAIYVGGLAGGVVADIPNGQELSVLQCVGDHAIVHWDDTVGFVKRRNTMAVPEA